MNNPQMEDLETLVPTFEEETGIEVNLTVLPENDVRDSIQTRLDELVEERGPAFG